MKLCQLDIRLQRDRAYRGGKRPKQGQCRLSQTVYSTLLLFFFHTSLADFIFLEKFINMIAHALAGKPFTDDSVDFMKVE